MEVVDDSADLTMPDQGQDTRSQLSEALPVAFTTQRATQTALHDTEATLEFSTADAFQDAWDGLEFDINPDASDPFGWYPGYTMPTGDFGSPFV